MLKFHRGNKVRVRDNFNCKNHKVGIIRFTIPKYFKYSEGLGKRLVERQYFVQFSDATIRSFNPQRIDLI